EWGQGIGIEKISNASDGHSFSIVARPLDDTLEYYFSIDPSGLDSVVIDTLGVWQLAVRAGEASAELASDLKHVGRVSLSSTGESITFTPNTARYDYWVVDPVGNKFRLGRDGEAGQREVTFKHSVSIYPNPFNPATTFRVTLAGPETLSVRVFNLLGQEVAVLASGWHDTGEYAFQFNASTLASGVYVYQVQIGREVQTGKLQLLK
ncbi:MAG: T9SS type A sorting domain-containing protein, partial [Bacteroidetes bacterium]|nr:T9SS type A sorting domain-containing protein [Bacteroidota bacterium]